MANTTSDMKLVRMWRAIAVPLASIPLSSAESDEPICPNCKGLGYCGNRANCELNAIHGQIESGKRTTSAVLASGHGIPDAAPATQAQPAGSLDAQEAVANAGDAQAACGGCARPSSCQFPCCQCLGGAAASLRDTTDAARYRWLRAGNYPIGFARSVLNDTPHGIDAAIDAAMAKDRP